MIFLNVSVTWYLKRSENDQKRSKMDKNGQNTKNSVIKSTSNTKFEVHFSKNHCKHPFSMVSIDYYTYLIDTPKFFRNVPDPNKHQTILVNRSRKIIQVSSVDFKHLSPLLFTPYPSLLALREAKTLILPLTHRCGQVGVWGSFCFHHRV